MIVKKVQQSQEIYVEKKFSEMLKFYFNKH